MRHTLLCLTFITCCHGFLYSQIFFGVSLGVDFTKTRFDTEFTGDPGELSDKGFSNPSLSVGLYFQHIISSKLVLDVDVSFTQKNNINRFNPQFEATLIPIAPVRVEFGLVKTSGIVKYKIFEKWHAGLGLSHRYIINANTILLNGDVRRPIHNRINMALIFGVSYQYKQFFIDVSYAKGRNFDISGLSGFYNFVDGIDNFELSIRYSLISSKEKKK